VLKRASSEKPLPAGQARPGVAQASAGKKGQSAEAAPVAPPAPMEDWWLIRDEPGHVGWVLARMVDVDIPIEIAQYSEGQRTVAAFVLDQVTMAIRRYRSTWCCSARTRMACFDFSRSVFTWNVKAALLRNGIPRARS
jgi:SH3-like domain-containing protein